MTQALDTEELYALYTAGHSLILPSAHAARVLRARFRAIPRPSEATVPELLSPLAWSEWSARLWSSILLSGSDDRILLNRLQEEQLWVDILGHQPAASRPADLRELATLARSGLQRAAAYRVLDCLHLEADSPDSLGFVEAINAFRTYCARHRLLSPALLEEALAVHLGSGTHPSPETLHLVGFERESPGQQHLLTALERAGCKVCRHTLRNAQPAASNSRLSCVFPNQLEELRFAVRSIVQRARVPQATSPSIALVCLAEIDSRAELERQFRELLAPELESVHADLSSTPWQFVPDAPLRFTPILAAALDILHWAIRPLPLEQIGQLLLSPFFTHADPLESRARFEIRTLRRSPILRPALDLVTFLPLLRAQTAANKERQVSFPELRALSRAAEHANLSSARRSYSQWADEIRQLLHAVGWPGPRSLSPSEFRAVAAWESLLDLLSTLDFGGKRIDFPAFLDQLFAEATTQPIPPANPEAAVQVLTLEDTEALSFDHCVILDATDKHLPHAEPRHPLLPQGLQRNLGVGDPVRSLAQAHAALDSLAQRSAVTLLLTPAYEDDSPSQLTPLAAQLAFRPVDPSGLLPAEVLPGPLPTEAATGADCLPALEDAEVNGGAEVLRLQAACGFRAFASLRLVAGEPQARDLGLNALDAGRILHTALELLWARLESQASLRALSHGARFDLVSETVETSLGRLRPYPGAGDAWSEHFLKVLRKRFTALLHRWLDMELQRSPFTVLAHEQQATLTLGPIRLKLRPDRIDQVEGGLVFVDYKSTYDLNIDHWTDTRPDAPQLPVYALSVDPEQVKGIAFAQIRPDPKKLGWISLSQQPGIFPKSRNRQVNMRDQVQTWHDELSTLAGSFAAGDTQVDPKLYPQTCKFCAHRALCRLDPNRLLKQIELDDEPVEEEELRG